MSKSKPKPGSKPAPKSKPAKPSTTESHTYDFRTRNNLKRGAC